MRGQWEYRAMSTIASMAAGLKTTTGKLTAATSWTMGNETLNVYPSIEAIDEVRVLTSNYGAQYGRNASGTIEVETKSGTNNFHGSAYEFLRNEAFNAHNYFDLPGTPKAPYK